jgi:hypothetical protein
MDRKELVNNALDSVFGRFAPQLPWENGDIEETLFTYNQDTDSMVTENNISMKLTLKDEEINPDSMYNFLIEFQTYVREQLKERFNINVDFDW